MRERLGKFGWNIIIFQGQCQFKEELPCFDKISQGVGGISGLWCFLINKHEMSYAKSPLPFRLYSQLVQFTYYFLNFLFTYSK